MNNDKKYTLNLTGNECDLIEFALRLTADLEDKIGKSITANKMEKLAKEIYTIHYDRS